jgi:hypothetical protein
VKNPVFIHPVFIGYIFIRLPNFRKTGNIPDSGWAECPLFRLALRGKKESRHRGMKTRPDQKDNKKVPMFKIGSDG